MTEPTYTTTTERLWRRLPEFYRNLDATTTEYENVTSTAYPFKRFISSVSDELNDIDTTVERLKFVPIERRNEYIASRDIYNTYTRPAGLEDAGLGFLPLNETSDLFDGRTADEEWLVWLGKLTGAKVNALESEATKRDKVINGYVGFKAGSKTSMANAVKEVLTGTKYAQVYDHTSVVSGALATSASEWDVTIVTKATETPAGTDTAAVIIAKGAKPAGVKLYYLPYSVTWTLVESTFTTWTLLEAALTWDTIEFTGA